MHEADLSESSALDVDPHLLHERIAAHVVAGGVHDAALLGRGHHRGALGGRRRERLLAHDVQAALDRRERLRRVHVVRRADVQGVHLLAVEQLLEVVVRRSDAERRRPLAGPARHSGHLDSERLQRDRVDSRDEA